MKLYISSFKGLSLCLGSHVACTNVSVTVVTFEEWRSTLHCDPYNRPGSLEDKAFHKQLYVKVLSTHTYTDTYIRTVPMTIQYIHAYIPTHVRTYISTLYTTPQETLHQSSTCFAAQPNSAVWSGWKCCSSLLSAARSLKAVAVRTVALRAWTKTSTWGGGGGGGEKDICEETMESLMLEWRRQASVRVE